ncbi:hypothetical protein TSOC_001433 [Tetrabaena socialis]|uniref:Uncharacterized protein n=1 Tax=Tetrabaena socialis TaxID=47790 RepID=A0A2J8AGS8_9CHLO|nr:hypothetical protein TSOC_001433 [Tetrabaena socialis]|eukprot:PNH11723.1 hypothetical protein TSOC_001433 [Tetrabaena socialis]
MRSAPVASCSGRGARRAVVATVQVRRASRRALVARAMYNFAEVSVERNPGERRKGFLKREARVVLETVRGLTSMTSKQLSAVTHLLPPGTLEGVGIAAKLPRSNQGRKRQEALVAKMLRALEEERLAGAQRPQDAAAGPSHDDDDATAAAAAASGNASISSGSEEQEDLAAVLADATKRGVGKGGKLRRLKAPVPRSRALLRSLTQVLRPLAVRVVKEAADKIEEEGGEGEAEEAEA